MRLRIVVVAVGALLLTLALRHLARQPQTDSPAAAAVSMNKASRSAVPQPARLPRPPVTGPTAASEPPSASATNWLQRLLANDGKVTTLSREDINRWLTSGRTNAEDLLAAHQAGGGWEFLMMALTNFPNDPRVLFAAIALKDGPDAQRARLDRFKAAAPDNALADYLSARDHFKNSRPEQALADLLAASGKTGFQDYTLHAMQNAEELYLQAGKSTAEAKALGASTVLLPHLALLNDVAKDMVALQGQYLAVGDVASAEHLAQMGVQLGQRLQTGEGARFFFNQLVGIAVDRLVLGPLDTEKNYNFLGGSVSEYMAQLDARRAAVKEDGQYLDQWIVNASETDIISFFDRVKIYGDSGALAWLRQRQAGQ
jgi:hypothetical protein